jgi:hypothetical protein
MKKNFFTIEKNPINQNSLSLYLLTALCLIAIIILLFQCALAQSVDEIGLFNPIYMYLTTHKLSYPAFVEYHAITIHPPLNYLTTALWMKLGMPLRFAMVMMSFILVLIAFGFLIFSPYQLTTKYVVILAITATIIMAIRNYGISVRPDLNVFLAWAAALLTLEGARLSNWSIPQFFIGAFLITYACVLHYFATFSALGIFVYIIWAWRLKLDRRTQITIALLSGAFLFAALYWAIYVIPNFHYIKNTLFSVHNMPGIIAGPKQHWDLYRGMSVTFANSHILISKLIAFFLKPGIPFAFCLVLLWFRKDLRGFALAAIPLSLFLLLTTWKSSTYVTADIFLLLLTLGFALNWIIKKIYSFFRLHNIAFQHLTLSILGLVLIGYSTYQLWTHNPLKGLNDREQDLARAVGQALLGRNAFVAGYFDWYISGSHHWYFLTPDLDWSDNAKTIEPKKYFSNFDALVENQVSAIPSFYRWYLNGTLQMNSFYQTTTSNLGYYVLKSSRPKHVTGYLYNGEKLIQFSENAQGKFIYSLQLCNANLNKTVYQNFLDYLQYQSVADVSAVPEYKNLTLVSGLLTKNHYQKIYPQLSHVCKEIRTVTGEIMPADTNKLLADLKQYDTPISFDRNSVFIDHIYKAPVEPLKLLPQLISLQNRTYPKKVDLANDGALLFVTPKTLNSYVSAFPVKPNKINHPGWCKLTFNVDDGPIAITLFTISHGENPSITNIFSTTKNYVTTYFPISNISDLDKIVVSNGDQSHRGKVLVKEIGIYQRKSDS